MAQIKISHFMVTIKDGKITSESPYMETDVMDAVEGMVPEYVAVGARRDNALARIAADKLNGEIISLDEEPEPPPPSSEFIIH